MLQDKINEISPYFKSIEKYNDALICVVIFPKNWAVFNSDSGKIKVAASDRKAYEYFYYGDGNEVSLEDIFDFIKNTIEVNQSLEIKAKLLVQKAKELQDLFEVTPLEKLKTLEFTMKEPKKARAKRKYTKKQNKALKVESGATVSNSGETQNLPIQEASAATSSTTEVHVSTNTLSKLKMAKKLKEKKI